MSHVHLIIMKESFNKDNYIYKVLNLKFYLKNSNLSLVITYIMITESIKQSIEASIY